MHRRRFLSFDRDISGYVSKCNLTCEHVTATNFNAILNTTEGATLAIITLKSSISQKFPKIQVTFGKRMISVWFSFFEKNIFGKPLKTYASQTLPDI